MSMTKSVVCDNIFAVFTSGKRGADSALQCDPVNAKENSFRGDRVAAIRKTLGWTHEELAHQILRRCGTVVSLSQLSQIENNGRNPSISVAIALAVVLETSLDYLTGIIEYDRGLNAHDEITVIARTEEQKTDVQQMVNPFMELNDKDRKMVIDLVFRLHSNGEDSITVNEKRFRRVIAALSDKLGGEVVADIAAAYGVSL